MRLPDLSVYLVLDPQLCAEYGLVETARAAALAGVSAIQLRDKTGGTAKMIETGRALQVALTGTGARLIVNDDVDAALELDADGIHVGQEDMAAEKVRAKIGPGPLLGVSVETETATRAVDPAIVDYVGAGPVFSTPTKTDHKAPIGFAGLARLVEISPVPAVAIGGLKFDHVAATLATGAKGLAVVSAICGQPDPAAASRAFVAAVREARS